MALNKKILLTAIVLAVMVFGTTPILTHAATPLFKVTLIAPGNANILRRQWGAIIANSMQFVGIDAQVVFLSWGAVYARSLTPAPDMIGKTYDQGGFDIQLIGWTPGAFPVSGYFQIYYGANTPPNSNYMLWKNATFDKDIETTISNGYNDVGRAAFWDAQTVEFNDLPASQILFSSTVMPANPAVDFNGYAWVWDNLGPVPDFIKYPGHTSFVFASTGELLALNPPLSNSWYDTIAFNPIYSGLFGLDSQLNVVPNLATSVDISADKYTYTYHLRPNVQWQDGAPFTADDVLFSLYGTLYYPTGTQAAGFYSGFIGEDITFVWLNKTQTRLVLNNDEGTAWYGPATGTPTVTAVNPDRKATVTAIDANTVSIKIANFGASGKPAAIFHPEGDGFAIIPKHVLEGVDAADWLGHSFNTGVGTYTANGKPWVGPVGTGPYQFVSYDSVTALVHLKKFNGYWNRTAEEAQGLFGITDYYVKYIVEKDPAIAALKTGDADALDQNYQMQKDVKLGNLAFAKVYTLPNSGIQQMGYNMKHPIFGTGTATPKGQTDPANAWLYARYVRTAFDLLIPRQQIIDQLLDGYGDPADVHVPTTAVMNMRNPNIHPRPYDPELAKSYLASAGYATGAAPLPAPTPTVPTFYLGFTFPVTGRFANPVTGVGYANMIVVLQQSADNSTWKGVAQSVTGSDGSYTMFATPPSTGTWYYRVYFPGVTAAEAAFGGAAGPNYDYSKLPTVLPPEYGAVSKVTVASLDDTLKGLATSSSVSALQSQLSQLQSSTASLQASIDSLQGQLGTTTTLVYGAIVLAIVVGAAGFLFARRRQ